MLVEFCYNHGDAMLSFDRAYYLAQNPDVAVLGVDPQAHYDAVGYLEGRDPSPYFDTAYYLAQNPDVAISGQNPFDHFNMRGAFEGRDPSATIDVAHMVALGVDVEMFDLSALQNIIFVTDYYVAQPCDVDITAVDAGTCFAPVVCAEIMPCDEIDNAEDVVHSENVQDNHFFNALMMTYASALMAADVLDDVSDDVDETVVVSVDRREEVEVSVNMLVVLGNRASENLRDDALLRPVASNDNEQWTQANFAVHQNLYVPKSVQISMAVFDRGAASLRVPVSATMHHHDPTWEMRRARVQLNDMANPAALSAGVLGTSLYPYDRLIA